MIVWWCIQEYFFESQQFMIFFAGMDMILKMYHIFKLSFPFSTFTFLISHSSHIHHTIPDCEKPSEHHRPVRVYLRVLKHPAPGLPEEKR